MSVVAIVMLALTGAVSAVLWWLVDPRRHAISTTTALAALGLPGVVLGTAAVFAVAGGPTSEVERWLAVVFGTISAVTGGGVVAICVLRLADRFAAGRVSGAVPPPPPPPPAPGGTTAASSVPVRDAPVRTLSDPDTLRGGAWIGTLERLAIVATLLTRWPEGLAVILAVKGLGRYPELRRPTAAERFIIGTLASALWAVACVGVVVALGGGIEHR